MAGRTAQNSTHTGFGTRISLPVSVSSPFWGFLRKIWAHDRYCVTFFVS